jgi:hypothetical protein
LPEEITGILKNSGFESPFMNDKSEETRMSRNEKARQELDADIAEGLNYPLVREDGPFLGNSKSRAHGQGPRLDESGYMLYPLTLLERGLRQDHPDPSLPSEGIDIPLPRPEKVIVIQDRPGEDSFHRIGFLDAYENWEDFFNWYPWAFRCPADESVLLPFEKEYFDDREKMRQRQPLGEEYRRIAWLMASGMDEVSALDEVRGGCPPPGGLDLDYENSTPAGMLRPRQPYEVCSKTIFLPALPLSEQQREDLDALLDAAVATKIQGPEWGRAFEEWQERYPEWGPDGDGPKA